MRKGVIFGVRGGLALLAIVALLAICLPRTLAQDGLGGVGGRPWLLNRNRRMDFHPTRSLRPPAKWTPRGLLARNLPLPFRIN